MKHLLSLTIACLGLFSALQSRSQCVIKGTVKAVSGKSLQLASITLLRSKDSSLVQSIKSDTSGRFVFENIYQGKYFIAATFTGMKQTGISVFEVPESPKQLDIGVVSLEEASVSLNNVTIVSKRPIFEQKIDRMVINVKSSITDAGGTALDVLEKSPGVTVNKRDNTIAINGKSGVNVMVNGRISYLPMDALVQYLAAINANSIDKIELITSPPSKYDAAGNGGYINIVLINNPNEGFNGSYFLSGGSAYDNKQSAAAGINFNYRSSKVNLFGNYSWKHEPHVQPSVSLIEFTNNGNKVSNSLFSDRQAATNTQNIRLGMDYQIDSSTVVGALVGGFVSHWYMSANNTAAISRNGFIDSTITTFNKELNYWNNVLTNVNFQHSFKPGNVLYFDLNYIYYKDYNPNSYLNKYYNSANQFLNEENLRSEKMTPMNFRVASLDYSTVLGKIASLETGGKISSSRFSNTGGVSQLKGTTWVPDTTLAANYRLNETIAAAYGAITLKPNSKLTLKAGVRYEYTNTALNTPGSANVVNRQYGELFPSFSLSHDLDINSRFNFNYNRRITRPAFTDLAPFTIFFDPKTFFSGNPALLPAIANSFQTSYDRNGYIFTLAYTEEKNTIESFYFQAQRIDPVKNILYLSADNFKSEDYLTASFSLPFSLTSTWSMQNNVDVNWKDVSTILNSSPVHFKNIDYKIGSVQRFKLPKYFSVELTGFYTSDTYIGTSQIKPLYQVNIGFQKKLKNKLDVFRFTANDLFNTAADYKITDKRAIPNASVTRDFNFATRAFTLTYTHSFGNTALEEKKRRSIGAENEVNRVHN